MTRWCSVCRFFPAFPNFDLCEKCLDAALEADERELPYTRTPTSQIAMDFTGLPLARQVEVIAYL